METLLTDCHSIVAENLHAHPGVMFPCFHHCQTTCNYNRVLWLEWLATVPSALTRVFQTRGRHWAKVLRADANTRLQLHSFVYTLIVTVIMFKGSYWSFVFFQSIIRFYNFMRIDRPNCRQWLREHLLQIHFAILQLWGTGFCRWVGKQVSNPAILNKSPITSKCTLWESSWVASSETVHWSFLEKETRAGEKWIQTRLRCC